MATKQLSKSKQREQSNLTGNIQVIWVTPIELQIEDAEGNISYESAHATLWFDAEVTNGIVDSVTHWRIAAVEAKYNVRIGEITQPTCKAIQEEFNKGNWRKLQ